MIKPFPQRRDHLHQHLKQESMDGTLVSNPVNVSYLTGFSGDSSYLLLTQNRAILFSDGRYTTQIEEECPDIEANIRPPAVSLQENVGTVLTQMEISNVEFDPSNLTVAQLETLKDKAPTINWKGQSGRVEKLRQIKDNGELDQIKQAISIAEQAWSQFRQELQGTETEKDLADAMEMYIRKAGGRCSSFPPILAVDDRAALPHATPSPDRSLANAELLLIDWGATGPFFYKSDLTRVLFRARKSSSPNPKIGNGSPPQPEKIFEIVLHAQQQAINALRPGAKAGDVDAAARMVIADAGYGANFTHSIGHGIGMDIHEAPMMKPGLDLELQAGMVVTIEPGIYIPGWGGIRIEDDVLITPDGPEVLSRVPKEFSELLLAN